MNLRIPLPALLLCLVVTLASADALAAVSAAGSAPAMRLPATPMQEPKFECHGVCQMGQTLYASIRDAVTGRSEWCELNRALGGWTVTDIKPHQVILRDRRSGKELVLNNTAAAPAEMAAASEPVAKRKPFSKAWINSEDNPMLRHLQSLPTEVVQAWPELPADQKAAIIDFYRNHGWQLLGAEYVNGSGTFTWKNIYEEERSAAIAENRREYEQSLSPEQLAAYRSIRRNPMMNVLNGRLTPEQEAEGRRRRAEADKFRDSLSAKQLEQMNGIPDFTKKLGVPDVD